MVLSTTKPISKIGVSISLRWRPAGDVIAVRSRDGSVLCEAMMPVGSRRPGLYRITIPSGTGRLIYVGESQRISVRLRAYKHPPKAGSRRTESFVSRQIFRALEAGTKVSVDVATSGSIVFGNVDRRLDMRYVAERRFAEAAAVLVESESAEQDWSVAVLNRILDDQRWLAIDE